MTRLLPGAEPWSHEGGRAGALCLHGFTGSPSSMRPVAEAFAAAGFSVELPRLPGHGTSVDDLQVTGWHDWSSEAEAGYQRLATRCEHVVVAGQSMGGALALWLGTRHPGIAGLVCINPLTQPLPAEVLHMVRGMVAAGETMIPGSGSDIADPDVTDASYDGTPLVPVLSLMDALEGLQASFELVTMPVLLLTSRQDHVVDPAQSDHVAALVKGPVERMTLERSYHVATLDYDRALVQETAVHFARRVTGA
jgi:carboxylesterase